MTKLTAMLLVLALAACAPNTIIRRTALINAPQSPTREGLPLEKGAVRLQGHVGGLNTAESGGFFLFEPGVAEIGSPGVLIPDLQIGASVWAGLPLGLEFGGQFYYASMGWADPNVYGVLPFPRGQEEDLFMGGLGLRLNVDVSNPRLVLAILGELNVSSVPEAIFICTDEERCTSDQVSDSLEGSELYTFDRVEHDLFFLPNLALQFGWRFGRLPGEAGIAEGSEAPMDDGLEASVMPYLMLGVQSSVTNTGFEPDMSTLREDSLEALWVGYFGFGVDAMLDALVLGGSMMIPVEGEEAIDFGVIFNFHIGAQL